MMSVALFCVIVGGGMKISVLLFSERKSTGLLTLHAKGLPCRTFCMYVMKTTIAAIVFLLLTLPAIASADDRNSTHPYDEPERTVRGLTHRNNKRSWGYAEIQRLYASRYRTTTHMLHPYYRSQPYERYGRIPESQFTYSYDRFAKEVIRPDRVY
ncbi:hypothetical protein CO157_00610 [Candidatus Peregrinibacteria bacterium CG_4_9_14_3_um_filter_49_12]|nr:MAG: hypothetical protein COV83_01570 [Candidatus Peregrinibacteria bacterium CG11_big_fil_rev_8_21_14_0_20_49_14]PJA68213.1 MAG: hypothetical protein CO157_00610 [Candidatus Peregrinibacteria bacterium CG_4_9_14_3_um_filter_49_12]